MDGTTLLLVAIIVVAALFLLPRLLGRGGAQRVDYSRPGGERPRVDSPDIDSRGAIGGRPDAPSAHRDAGPERPQVDSPDVDSRGGFGRDRPNEERERGAATRDRDEGGRIGARLSGSDAPAQREDDKPDKKGGSAGDLGAVFSQRAQDDDPARRAQPRAARERDDDEPGGGRIAPRVNRERDQDPGDDEPRRRASGDERPSADDPDVESRGGFGRDKG
ncbi:MAG: hypothetical protein HXY40_09305 [Chloroflexi bacterium]|nr:hypothetical protein [Chloroflexota bacterium]